jgi:tetratricopeptide (TPR) repeat protein
MDIDIPAGASNYQTTASFKLPADVDVIGVLPHAHYRAKKMEGFALLPNGWKQWLLLINNWDFNWQGDYSYKNPIFLPKGTIVELRYTYDNSSSNPQNPVIPPQRVKYGVQSSDEMAELWLQMLPRSADDAKALTKEYNLQIARESVVLNEMLLRQDPKDAASLVELGKARMALGDVTNAIPCFEKAVNIKPSPEAHYHLGLALEMVHAEYPARQQYEAALVLDPTRYMARNNLGLLFLRHGEFATAEHHFREVLKEHPDNSMALKNLELTLKLAAKYAK